MQPNDEKYTRENYLLFNGEHNSRRTNIMHIYYIIQIKIQLRQITSLFIDPFIFIVNINKFPKP